MAQFWDVVRAAEPMFTLILLAITVHRLDAAIKRIEMLEGKEAAQ